MNYAECVELERLDLCRFATVDPRIFGFDVVDSIQTDKYYHNFMWLTNSINSGSLLQEYWTQKQTQGFVAYRMEQATFDLDVSFLPGDYEIHRNGYYAVALRNLTIPLPKQTFQFSKIEESLHESFGRALFESCHEFGESYATCLVQRMVPLLTKESPFRFDVLIKDNVIIAMIRTFISKTQAGIEDFYVLPAKRNQGYGSALMRHMIAEWKALGVEEIYLVADEEDTPRLMYQKWGFRPVGESRMILWKAQNSQKEEPPKLIFERVD